MRLQTWTFSGLILLAGCTSTPLGGNAPTSGDKPSATMAPAQLLGGLALPPGSFILADKSLIIGSGDAWVGRAAVDVGRDADAAYRYFLDNLSAQGWTVVTAVRGRQSLMVLTRQERTLTVELAEPMLGSATAYLTMAPRNAAVMAPKKP